MKLTINGETKTFSDLKNVSELLVSLDMDGKPVVVELNKDALFPRDFASTQLHEGDRVEIITIAAGG